MSLVRVAWVAVAIGLAVVGWSAVPSQASAQTTTDEEARALFEAGRLAFSRARYAQALENFREAHALGQRPAVLYHIGVTLDRLRRDREAIDAFEQFLGAQPESELVPEVQERLRILRENLPPSMTPEAVAAASDPSDPGAVDDAPSQPVALTDAPSQSSERDDRLVKKWWFWTLLGVVVVGGAVGVGLGASGGGGQQGPLPYDNNTFTIEL